MTSPSSRISTGSFFSGWIFEYSSFGVPGATVAGTSSILSISPSSIAAMRTLRANGEAGEKVSFMACPSIVWSSFRGRCEASNPESRDSGSGPSDHPGMTVIEIARRAAPSRCDDFLALLAQTIDTERDDIADIEEGLRLHAEADAGRRARGEDVARQQRQELRDIGD